MILKIDGFKKTTVHSRWEIVAFLARKNIVDEDYIDDCADEIRDIMKRGAEVCWGQLCPYHLEINETNYLIVSGDEDELRTMIANAREEI
ncbi:hypothetical protein AHP1_3261 [Aeromonas phage Ahp1_CNU-2021]|nr:hypothetical protein AHP1_3261 [Aeromonas phage Ahp1_CNU-2021]